MDDAQIQRTLTEARGYADLGFHQDAWDLVESLPFDSSRLLPQAIAVRLLVCAGLKKWVMGAELVRLIAQFHPLSEREAAGRFHLAHAESLCAAGDVLAARESVKALSTIWPEGRELVTGAKTLAAIWP